MITLQSSTTMNPDDKAIIAHMPQLTVRVEFHQTDDGRIHVIVEPVDQQNAPLVDVLIVGHPRMGIYDGRGMAISLPPILQ